MRKANSIVLICILVYTDLIILCSVDRLSPPVLLTLLTSICSLFAFNSKALTFSMCFSYAVNTIVCIVYSEHMKGYMFGGLLPNNIMFMLFNVVMLILMLVFLLVYRYDNDTPDIFICEDCGAEVGENDTFCPKCGTKFD